MTDIDLAPLLAERPHLFSPTRLTISADDVDAMASLVRAVDDVVAVQAYRECVLSWAPAIASHMPAGRGVFFGYDFHLTAAGPRLIEINTNAGGALLASWHFGRRDLEATFVNMFRAECPSLRTVAIVDEQPAGQYLYPEFLLFQDTLRRHGIEAIICAPEDLLLCHGGLWAGERRIDLVYNRLTDFSLATPAAAALRQCYLDGGVVLSPHPRAHALYADKRNLTVLSDDALLADWGVASATRAVLAAVVPATRQVRPDDADVLWQARKNLFFKPAGGFGSRAAYRGDKMTRGVFEQVLQGDYVAQALVPPSQVDGSQGSLKADVRCYAYNGQIQYIVARLWQGQTTNFRTPGGGFAEVVTA
jgi:hypothetical protein